MTIQPKVLSEFRSFGRRKGRKIRPKQEEHNKKVLPRLLINEQDIGAHFDPCAYFANSRMPLYLEIGFGGGEYLWQRIQNTPEVNFIGAEPYENGVSQFAQNIKLLGNTLSASNVKIWMNDVQPLLDAMPDQSVDRVDIMFPDPWPKLRHHRRRLIQESLLKKLCRIMKKDSDLYIATDHDHYLFSILALMQRQVLFCWTATSKEDWQEAWQGIRTRYAEKAHRQGRKGYYLHYCFKGGAFIESSCKAGEDMAYSE